MPPVKRKNLYLASYEKEFHHTKASKKGEEFAYCIVCKDDINLTSIGKSAITQHHSTKKHKEAALAANRSIPLKEFYPLISGTTDEDRKIFAAEGTWAYHLAVHSQSFLSAQCVSSDGLFKTIFPDSKVAQKYSSSRTKTTKILTAVLAPFSVKKLLENLGCQPFSISVDCSNHGNIKIFPLIIRFFTAKEGIQTKLLDLESVTGEKSAEIHEWIVKILERHCLKFAKMSAFCADNAVVNFGGAEQHGTNNVFSRMKAQKNELIGLTCAAHILHNAARRATEKLPLDLEAIIFRLASYFKSSTKRIEELKNVCKDLEVEFMAINNHGPTRWTTMERVLDKMIKLWEPFQMIFAEDGPKLLQDFFGTPKAYAICQFVCHALKIFNKSIDSLQKEKAIFPEMIAEMEKFYEKIRERQNHGFFGTETNAALSLVEWCARAELEQDFLKFYGTVLEYLNKWFRKERFPRKMDWLCLTEPEIAHMDVIKLAEQIAPELNKLFDEVTEANKILEGIPWDKFQKLNVEQKWQKIFEAELPELYHLVSIVLSVPVSNAYIERVFSLMGSQWTDERNSLNVETVKALVQIKVNFNLTCPKFYQMLISNRKLLDSIGSGEKYN